MFVEVKQLAAVRNNNERNISNYALHHHSFRSKFVNARLGVPQGSILVPAL